MSGQKGGEAGAVLRMKPLAAQDGEVWPNRHAQKQPSQRRGTFKEKCALWVNRNCMAYLNQLQY